ncbi:hypothetical protein ACMD2_06633 [Ananas comosus]|uniref:LYR motif-containing protein 2 n=1 Tax=Ananas comosus TaxID=4615 RepID=A0A199UFV3_ANACO|nr:hypothetical protein ACMD2_06633 [Ananas comosus]
MSAESCSKWRKAGLGRVMFEVAHNRDPWALFMYALSELLYRQALRTARRAPAHSRAELRQAMRNEIEKNKHCNDKQKIRFFISEGLQRLKGLDEMLDMTGRKLSSDSRSRLLSREKVFFFIHLLPPPETPSFAVVVVELRLVDLVVVVA